MQPGSIDLAGGTSDAAWADEAVRHVRDDPEGRLTLMARCYSGPFGDAPQHLPYRRAALSFMRWQLQREVLQPLSAARPGSPWWRAVNERILRDGCEAVALSGNLPGPASSPTVDHWMAFVDDPTGAQLVPGAQRERRRRLPGPSRPGGSRERAPSASS